MVNLKGQTGTGTLPWAATLIAILYVTTSAQGCHKGRFWRKITIQTSFSSGRPRGREQKKKKQKKKKKKKKKN
jgi:hypothetical protein